MEMYKKWRLILVGLLIFGGSYSCSQGSGDPPPDDDTNLPPKAEHYPGLSVSASGQLLLNGEPYRAIGVNYFNAFSRTLGAGQQSDTSYRKGLAYLKERNIPFVRFSINGYRVPNLSKCWACRTLILLMCFAPMCIPHRPMRDIFLITRRVLM